MTYNDDDDDDDDEDTTMTIKMMKMTMMRIQTHLLYDDKRRVYDDATRMRCDTTTRIRHDEDMTTQLRQPGYKSMVICSLSYSVRVKPLR